MHFVDVKGYYQSLGAEPAFSPGALKRAYRERVKEAHPDTGGAKDGAAFREITDAYEILGSKDRRADYDALCRSIGEARSRRAPPSQETPKNTEPKPENAERGRSPKSETQKGAAGAPPETDTDEDARRDLPEPVRCKQCGTVSAQPRYVVFRRVIGMLWRSKERRIRGVYCRTCADQVALRASLVTWLLGWWSLPRGPIATVHALLRNMAGGETPADRNADILTQQSQAFAARGKPALASVLAMQAHGFRPDPALVTLMGLGDGRKLKDRWQIGGLSFFLQALPIGLFAAWLLVWAATALYALF